MPDYLVVETADPHAFVVPDGPVHQAGPEITTVTGSGLDEVASNIFVSSTGLLPALVEIDGAGRPEGGVCDR